VVFLDGDYLEQEEDMIEDDDEEDEDEEDDDGEDDDENVDEDEVSFFVYLMLENLHRFFLTCV
jgi:hypothetical protein